MHCATVSAGQLAGLDDPSRSYYGSGCQPVSTPATEDVEACLKLWQWSEQQVGWQAAN